MPAAAQAAGLPSRLGKYELLLPLAAGGMARIYIGRSTGIGQFERHVVLKMITPERANDLTAVNMFLDEARLAASLNHQNVAQVFEVGEEGGIHYLAMEYVHGQDLRAVLAKAGSAGTRIPLELALTVVAGAAAGLNHAHERRGPDGTPLGIVHRDVSPSNIMIGYDGAVKLLDFGIAKATQRSVETQSGIIKGKFAYMAPEQCRGRDVDRRSDVFSLGIILYEISTQHRCFRADSDFDTMHRIVTGDVVRPTRLVQGYPQALEAIVMKALATDPAQRYQSAGLLLEALESFAVSSRMSLSTMGLGRFMRDMFGEVQEPWLNASMKMAAAPVVAKENTISSTDGRSNPRNIPTTPIETLSSGAPSDEDEGRFEDSDKHEAAKTLLQMPRNPEDGGDADAGGPGWSPHAYPAPQPSSDAGGAAAAYANQSGTHRVPPGNNNQSGTHRFQGGDAGMNVGHAARQSAPYGSTPTAQGVPTLGTQRPTPPPQSPLGTQPMPMHGNVPQNQFPQQHTPGSGSSPAMPALQTPNGGAPQQGGPLAPGAIVSTKHGYASAAMSRGDVSYPRYEPPADAFANADVQLKPNRRPLFIGLGVVLLGVIVMLVVTFSGGSDPEPVAAPSIDDSSSGVAPGSDTEPDEPNQVAPGSASTELDDSMITIVVESDPPGADVLIAGAKVGVTPFNNRIKRGTKVVQLSIHKDGFADYTTKIDLSGSEYENKSIKLTKADAADADGATPANGGTDDNADQGDQDASDDKDGNDNKAGASGTGDTSKPTGTTSTKPATTGGTTTKPNSGGTTTRNTGTTKPNTGTTTPKPPKAPKCQPPGPNVDPFGPPICKT